MQKKVIKNNQLFFYLRNKIFELDEYKRTLPYL